jgi:hypothetical protein
MMTVHLVGGFFIDCVGNVLGIAFLFPRLIVSEIVKEKKCIHDVSFQLKTRLSCVYDRIKPKFMN